MVVKNRLAIVMPSYFEENFGGAEYQASLLAEAATELGHEVHYIFATLGKTLANPLGIHLHPVPRRKISKRFGRVWWLYTPQIRKLLEEIQPDATYVRSGVAWAGAAAQYARKNGRRSIWHVAHLEDVTPLSIPAKLRRPFDFIERRAVDYAIRNSHIVVCHARYQAEALKKYFNRDSEVILKEQPEPTEVVDKSGPFTVLWVANIKGWKQPEVFIRLAREFSDDHRVRFVMVGRPAGGEYQKYLEASMEGLPNLDYLGELPIDVVNELLAKSHVFVNTSTNEGLPNTFVQAWMREVPVVSLMWDPDDILKPGEIGFCSGSFEQMVRDVRTLIENPSVRNEMGKRAREYALENHSLKKNMGRLLNLILDDAPPPPDLRIPL